ncbi:MAG: FtsW/RodA/SpoVE family cell cycle protein [Anaerotignum sp.]|nr:FtsW/RodA/SpoVE family cell cycle protein [Anaerotignum sp.]
MASSEQFKHYTEKVCEQIRWKKAHGVVAQEIENHLIDQKNAYMDMGDSESIAEEKALLQLGDPVAIGAALDGTHKPAPQWGMMGLVMVLFAVGTCIQFHFLTNILDEGFHNSAYSVPLTAALFLLCFIAFILTYFLDFSFFAKHPYLLPILLIVVDILAQLFGAESSGSYRWLILGPFSISPISISIIFPFAFCGIFYHLRNKGKYGYLLSGIIAAVFCMMLLTFHSSAGILLFVFSAGILMIIAAKKGWFSENVRPILLFLLIAGIIGMVVLLYALPYRYRLERLVYIIHPEADPSGYGYMPSILRGMLENSVLLGKGTSFLEWDVYKAILPTMYRTDYLLTFITYQYGWVASIAIILLLTIFLILGFRKCFRQKSVFGQMVSLCILCTYTAEILIYVFVNLGFPIVAPIALPFLSYGATALLLNMALAGILLSTFRTGEVYQDKIKPVLYESKFIQWDDGKLIISFK